VATQRLAAGSEIDGYRLDEKIHQGNMSVLWRVRGAEEAAPLVMKIPLVRDFDDPAAIVGFEVEQMILPVLSGPHVPRFVAAGDWAVQPYIVMESIGGGSLRDRLSDAPLEPAEIASLGARIASALHDIHRQHVVHLDVKPSNVLFRESGEAVLIDFGLSRHDRLPDLLAEEFRLPMGTGPYISPEQIRRVRDEPASDVYSLGVVLYFLATAVRPFGNPTSQRELRRRLYRDPVPPRARTPSVPPWLQEIILRCLEVDPGKRYETAGQLAFDLSHPEQIRLTARAERLRRDSLGTVWRRRWRGLGEEPSESKSAADRLARAPIVMVAVDVASDSAGLAEELRLAARRILQTESGARLACVTVLKTSRIAMDIQVDEEGRSLHVRRLIELQHWARPLNLPAAKITFHVLSAPDPGAAITEFARSNHVDQIVIGSRGSSTLRRYLGSVSSQVVANAECTVTVVKAGAPSLPDRISAARRETADPSASE